MPQGRESEVGKRAGKRVAGQQEGKNGKRVAQEKSRKSRFKDLSDVDTAVAIENMKGKEKRGQDLSPCSKSVDDDESLRKMFDEWATKYNRKYWCEKEREKRFKFFCISKKHVDKGNKREPGCFSLGENADYDYSKFSFPDGNPYVAVSTMSTNEGDYDDLKGEWIEFEKWAERHGRKYSCKEERTSRFKIFLDHKSLIDGFVKAKRCSCSTEGYDVDDMDMMCWEAPTWHR